MSDVVWWLVGVVLAFGCFGIGLSWGYWLGSSHG